MYIGSHILYNSVKDVDDKETILWVRDNSSSVWKLYLAMIFNWQNRIPFLSSPKPPLVMFFRKFHDNHVLQDRHQDELKLQISNLWYHLCSLWLIKCFIAHYIVDNHMPVCHNHSLRLVLYCFTLHIRSSKSTQLTNFLYFCYQRPSSTENI